jgi:hypothetical protein
MPVQPIDLQNLFLRLNQVGKEQSQQQQIAAQHQSLQGSQFVKEKERQDHSVNQPEDMNESTRKTDEEGSGGQRRSSSEEQKKKREQQQTKRSPLQDPNLGHHIDISR